MRKCEGCGTTDAELRWIFGGGDEDEPGNYDVRCERCASAPKWAEGKPCDQQSQA